MRQMMLYPVEFCAHCLAREGLLQQNLKSLAGAAIAYPAEHEVDIGALGQKIADLAYEVGATVLIKRNVVHIRNLNACLMQTIRDCMEGKPRPMLYAAESSPPRRQQLAFRLALARPTSRHEKR